MWVGGVEADELLMGKMTGALSVMEACFSGLTTRMGWLKSSCKCVGRVDEEEWSQLQLVAGSGVDEVHWTGLESPTSSSLVNASMSMISTDVLVDSPMMGCDG